MTTFKYLYILNLFAGRSPNLMQKYIILPRLTNPSMNITCRSFITEPPCCLSSDNWFKFFKIMANSKTLNQRPSGSFTNSETTLLLDSTDPELSAPAESDYFIPDMDSFEDMMNSSAFELSPEFFTFPPCFDDLPLPDWTSARKESFVYSLNNLLESEYFDQHINEWIDSMFLDQDKNKSGFCLALFSSPHPKRPKKHHPVNKEITTIDTTVHSITNAVISINDNKKFRLFVTTNESEIYEIKVNTEQKKVILSIPEPLQQNHIITERGFILASTIPDFYTSIGDVITLVNDSEVISYKLPEKECIMRLNLCPAIVTNACSTEYEARLLTIENELVFVDMKKRVRNVIQLNEKPYLITIAPENHFTLVTFKYHISIYDSFGTELTSIPFSHTTLVNSYHDFFIVCNSSKIGIISWDIEGTPSLRISKANTPNNVCAISYNPQLESVITLSYNGIIRIIPKQNFVCNRDRK